MKRKIISVCAALCLTLAVITGTSLAYFTDLDAKTNTFTLGNVDIELTETKWQEPEGVLPGIEYAKNPVVTNIGKNDAWIRVDVTVSDAKAFGAAARAHNIEDIADEIFSKNAADWDERWILAEDSPVIDEEKDTLTYSYYYKDICKAGENTGELFSAVTVPAAFNNSDMEAIGEDFTIDVTAYAIQTADSYKTVNEAFAAYASE